MLFVFVAGPDAVKLEQLRKVLDATPAPRPFGAAICPWPEADPSRRWVRTGFGRFGRGGKAQAPPKAAQWATLGGACCLATAPRQASKAGKRRAWVGHERPLPFCTSPVCLGSTGEAARLLGTGAPFENLKCQNLLVPDFSQNLHRACQNLPTA